MPSLPLSTSDTSSSSVHPTLAITLNHALTRNASFGLVSANSVNVTTILAAHQRHTIQVLATATSSISIVAAICALYWFCMMRRNFRRDLVLLLIVGDLSKSSWFLIYSAVTFVHGQVMSDSAFCQASGYMLQTSLVACGEYSKEVRSDNVHNG